MVLQYLSINNFDLTKKRKIRKKISLKKFVKIQRFCGICLFNNFHLTKKKTPENSVKKIGETTTVLQYLSVNNFDLT